MSEDPLQLFPIEKWSELEEVFEADIPRSIVGLIILDRQRYLVNCGLDFGYKVYCPFCDVNNGIVAITIKKRYCEVIVQCPIDDTSKLEEALMTTTIIDWKREIVFAFAPKHVLDCIQRVIHDKNLAMNHMAKTNTYVLYKTSPLFDVTLPPEITFDLLSQEHVDLLNSTWPHGYPDSDFYFHLIIKAKLGYGLFRDGKLISWVLIKDMGALLHLYTLEEERRKGYAELVLKLLSNILLKDGKHVVAFCIKGNTNAAKLYLKNNFQPTIDVDRCKCYPLEKI